VFFFSSIIVAAATGITDLIPVTGDLSGVIPVPYTQAAQWHLSRLKVLTSRPILPHVPQAATTATADKDRHVYKLAAKRQWVGEIEAVDERGPLR